MFKVSIASGSLGHITLQLPSNCFWITFPLARSRSPRFTLRLTMHSALTLLRRSFMSEWKMIKHKWNSNHMFPVVWPWVCVAFQRREQTLFAALGNRDRVCWVGVGGLYLHKPLPGVNWGQEGLPSWPESPQKWPLYTKGSMVSERRDE